MEPSIVCSDLDGTLLNSEGTVATPNQAAFRALAKRHVPLALASGRGLDSLSKFSDEVLQVPTHKICLDGSMVVDAAGNVLSVQIIPLAVLEEVVEIALRYRVVISFAMMEKSIIITPHSHFTTIDKYPNHIEIGSVADLREVAKQIDIQALKIGMNIADEQQFNDVYAAMEELPLHVMMADIGFIEATKQGVTKFSALQVIANHFNLNLRHAIAFGDFENDYELIGGVGYGVAMANATDHIKEAARLTTVSNDEHGVAKMLKQLVDQD